MNCLFTQELSANVEIAEFILQSYFERLKKRFPDGRDISTAALEEKGEDPKNWSEIRKTLRVFDVTIFAGSAIEAAAVLIIQLERYANSHSGALYWAIAPEVSFDRRVDAGRAYARLTIAASLK